MKLTKPSAGLIAEFKGVQEQLRDVAQPRKMFGYDALYVNGYLAVGLWKNTCTLKLSEGDQKKLIAAGNAKPFMPMPGRPMSGWVELNEDLANDPEELLEWSRRAVEFVATLPPKAPTAKKKAPAKKAPAKKTKKA
ncbi:MAG TPA: TfoX/Sxy family protein [Polyangiaceae bacterium]|nr:TfoX/Sxy family protein [Polyangiaceae bacterium]